MNSTSYKKIFSASIWGILAKVFDAGAKFLTIPMLVGFYSKADYGLIALAFSLNTYLRLMDMGMNIGSIRFFSMWLAQNEWDKIGKVSRSSIVFYGVIGIVNALIFVFMAHNSTFFFKLNPQQIPIFTLMMYILAASTVFNWTSNVISQLLSAHGELAWINRVTIISSFLNFLTAILAIKYKLALANYFFLYTLSTLVIIPLNIYRLRVYKMPLLALISPKWDGAAFREILGYSVSIFAMGIFQFSADNLRPLLLGKYASKGIAVLTEYRVIQTISMLIIAFGGVFLDALLPFSSKALAEKNRAAVETLAYSGTKYVSIFLSYVIFILAANANILLTIYMGPGYSELSIWLIIWLVTLLGMHNGPVGSLVLSTGKTRPLVYMSAVSCFVSLSLTAFFAAKYNVGAAVIGYCFYTILQIAFYYYYYTPKVLKLNSGKIFFSSFLPAVLVGASASLITYYFQKNYLLNPNIRSILISFIFFTIIFLILLLVLLIKPDEIKRIRAKILHS